MAWLVNIFSESYNQELGMLSFFVSYMKHTRFSQTLEITVIEDLRSKQKVIPSWVVSHLLPDSIS
jgi:hypothetical protein